MSKLIFMWMIASGQVQPMNEQNEGHELYILCIENDDAEREQDKVFCFEHAYEQEIIHYIETGEFQYNDFLLTNKNK